MLSSGVIQKDVFCGPAYIRDRAKPVLFVLNYKLDLTKAVYLWRFVGWGNGTSSTGGDAYPVDVDRLASHGFVVAVAHTNVALNGPVLLDTAARALALNGDPPGQEEDPMLDALLQHIREAG